jgi:FkbH-like protein
MTLIEALKILQAPVRQDAAPFDIFLACGFTPLHLKTLLEAHLRQLLPDRRIGVNTGLYGDLAGSIERIGPAAASAAVVIMEWEDLDPRLGRRRLASWGPESAGDVIESVKSQFGRIQGGLARVETRVALCLPTLPIPPLAHTPTWHASSLELELRRLIAEFAYWTVTKPNIRIVSPQQLDSESHAAARYDINADIVSGFPYTLPHAAAVARSIALLLVEPAPKKGLITDLDNTLWSGIVGEAGAANVSWDLDHGSHVHAMYQQLMGAFAMEGVLVGIASKNDPSIVAEVLRRSDLLIASERIWPVEVQWGPKSDSVSRILRAWNISADSVVFVDDSPMELAEVQAAHPDLECILFPPDDYKAACDLFGRLRDLFGKPALRDEDALRLSSLRSAAQSEEERKSAGYTPDTFLEAANARIGVSFALPPEPRALELINKTNQFNLNGKRFTESEWSAFVAQPSALVLVADYHDRYGPLGKIAVLAGQLEGKRLTMGVWVMSCRAFSRRIEHRCLEQLFSRFKLDEIVFDYADTPRNGPTREFFTELLGHAPHPEFRLGRETFFARCPSLFSDVYELTAA